MALDLNKLQEDINSVSKSKVTTPTPTPAPKPQAYTPIKKEEIQPVSFSQPKSTSIVDKVNKRAKDYTNLIVNVGGSQAVSGIVGSISTLKDIGSGVAQDLATDIQTGNYADAYHKTVVGLSKGVEGLWRGIDFASQIVDKTTKNAMATVSASADYAGERIGQKLGTNTQGTHTWDQLFDYEKKNLDGTPNYLAKGISIFSNVMIEGQKLIQKEHVAKQSFETNILKELSQDDLLDNVVKSARKPIDDYANNKLQEYIKEKKLNSGEADLSTLEEVAVAIPNLLSFAIGGKAVSAGIAKLGVSANTARGLASATNVILESGMEADQIKNDLLQQGYSPIDASKGALNAFGANVLLIGTSNKVDGLFDENTYKGLRKLTTYGYKALGEGSQEYAQQIVSNVNTDKDPFEGTSDAFVVGAVMGLGGSVIFDTLAKGGQVTEADIDSDVTIPKAKRQTVKDFLAGKLGKEDQKKVLAEGLQEIGSKTDNEADPTSEEYQNQVIDVRDLIVNGVPDANIINTIKDKYNLSEDYVSDLIENAKSQDSLPEEFVAQLRNSNDLMKSVFDEYQKATADGLNYSEIIAGISDKYNIGVRDSIRILDEAKQKKSEEANTPIAQQIAQEISGTPVETAQQTAQEVSNMDSEYPQDVFSNFSDYEGKNLDNVKKDWADNYSFVEKHFNTQINQVRSEYLALSRPTKKQNATFKETYGKLIEGRENRRRQFISKHQNGVSKKDVAEARDNENITQSNETLSKIGERKDFDEKGRIIEVADTVSLTKEQENEKYDLVRGINNRLSHEKEVKEAIAEVQDQLELATGIKIPADMRLQYPIEINPTNARDLAYAGLVLDLLDNKLKTNLKNNFDKIIKLYDNNTQNFVETHNISEETSTEDSVTDGTREEQEQKDFSIEQAIEQIRVGISNEDPAMLEAISSVDYIYRYAEAGERIFLPFQGARSDDPRVIGKPSTFPQSLDENLRSKKLLDEVLPYYERLERPQTRGYRKQAIFDQMIKDTILMLDHTTKLVERASQLSEFEIINNPEKYSHLTNDELAQYNVKRNPITNELEEIVKFQKKDKNKKVREMAILSDEEVLEQIKGIPFLEELSVNKVRQITRGDGGLAWGSYFNGLIKYVENPKATTLPHEAFHAFTDLVLTADEKKAMFNIAKEARPDLKSNIDVEEYLAEDFAKFYVEEIQPATLLQKIFAKIKEALRKMFGSARQIQDFYWSVVDTKNNRIVKAKIQAMKDIEETKQEMYSSADGLTLKSFDLIKSKIKTPTTNRITLQNLIKGLPIKSAEKDVLSNTLDEAEFDGKFSVDDFIKAVQSNLLDIQVVPFGGGRAYSNYGLDNLGVVDDNEAYTFIVNTGLNHGYEGHFISEFGNSKISKNNLEIKKIEAGTHEVNGQTQTVKEDQYYVMLDHSQRTIRGINETNIETAVFGKFKTEQEAQNYIDNFEERKVLPTSGLMGHFRINFNGDYADVLEIQSDTFQKKDISERIAELEKRVEDQKARVEEVRSQLNNPEYRKSNVEKRIVDEQEKLALFEKELADLKPKLEQFQGFKNTYHELFIRQIIQQASMRGATKVRFPSPHKVATIEGYIEGNNGGEYSADEVYVGNTITYEGDNWYVVKIDYYSDKFGAIRDNGKIEVYDKNKQEEVKRDKSSQFEDDLQNGYEDIDVIYEEIDVPQEAIDRINEVRQSINKNRNEKEYNLAVYDILQEYDEAREAINNYIDKKFEDFDIEQEMRDIYGDDNVRVDDNGVVYVSQYSFDERTLDINVNNVSKEDFDINSLNEDQAKISAKYGISNLNYEYERPMTPEEIEAWKADKIKEAEDYIKQQEEFIQIAKNKIADPAYPEERKQNNRENLTRYEREIEKAKKSIEEIRTGSVTKSSKGFVTKVKSNPEGKDVEGAFYKYLKKYRPDLRTEEDEQGFDVYVSDLTPEDRLAIERFQKKTNIEDIDTDLKEEARQYDSAEAFVEAKFSEYKSYSMSHRPSYFYDGDITYPRSFDLLENDILPDDVYEHPEYSIASGRNVRTDKSARESWEVIKAVRGNPEAEVTVYRASPKNELNIGDWVTFSKNYAKSEGSYEGVKTYAYKVKAKDVVFAGDDINEFGYFPKDNLVKIWNTAHSEKYQTMSPNEIGTRYFNNSYKVYTDLVANYKMQQKLVADLERSKPQVVQNPNNPLGAIIYDYDFKTPNKSTVEGILREVKSKPDYYPKHISERIEAIKSTKETDPNFVKNTNEVLSEIIGMQDKSVLRKSAVADRLTPDSNTYYEATSFIDQIAKAQEVINDKPEDAKKIAMGEVEAPAGLTATAVNIQLAKKALENGNTKEYADLVNKRSRLQSKRGQEIVMENIIEKDSVDDVVKQVMERRKELARQKYTSTFNFSRVMETYEEVRENLKKSTKKKVNKALEAQIVNLENFLDTITC